MQRKGSLALVIALTTGLLLAPGVSNANPGEPASAGCSTCATWGCAWAHCAISRALRSCAA